MKLSYPRTEAIIPASCVLASKFAVRASVERFTAIVAIEGSTKAGVKNAKKLKSIHRGQVDTDLLRGRERLYCYLQMHSHSTSLQAISSMVCALLVLTVLSHLLQSCGVYSHWFQL
jgi:ABC-type uncharacterized transport system permease subunit